MAPPLTPNTPTDDFAELGPVAILFAKALCAGIGLIGTQDPTAHALVDDLTEDREEWCEKVATALLEDEAAALRALLRALVTEE